MKETIKAKTDKEYDEMRWWVIQDTEGDSKEIGGKTHYVSGTEKISFNDKRKEVIIQGKKKEEINEMKKYLELYIRAVNY